MIWNKLVPELIVTDLAQSRKFWIDLIGFEILYQREEEQFMYLGLGDIQIMLEQQSGPIPFICVL